MMKRINFNLKKKKKSYQDNFDDFLNVLNKLSKCHQSNYFFVNKQIQEILHREQSYSIIKVKDTKKWQAKCLMIEAIMI